MGAVVDSYLKFSEDCLTVYTYLAREMQGFLPEQEEGNGPLSQYDTVIGTPQGGPTVPLCQMMHNKKVEFIVISRICSLKNWYLRTYSPKTILSLLSWNQYAPESVLY